MSKYLITGGAGFIGSHLCKKLIDLDHEVICLDNFYNGNYNNIVPVIVPVSSMVIRLRPGFTTRNHFIPWVHY